MRKICQKMRIERSCEYALERQAYMNTYYPISITYRGETLYAIWYSHEREGLICRAGRLLTFASLPVLRRYAADHPEFADLAPELHRAYDLDALQAFCADENRFAGANELELWSLFADLAAGIGKSFAGDGNSFLLNDIYEKLCMAGIDFPYGDDGEDGEDSDRFVLTSEEEALTKAVLQTGIELYARYHGEPIA